MPDPRSDPTALVVSRAIHGGRLGVPLLSGIPPALRGLRPASAMTADRPGPENHSHEPSGAARRIRRTIKLVVLLIVFYYLVLPVIAAIPQRSRELLKVHLSFLVLAVGLEVAALVAYAQLMSVALPPRAIGLSRLFRIQLSTKALNNVVPGGSAAGVALGYRLLTTSGVQGPDAGFALAATGLVSACVLNAILWLALLLSLPFHGINVVYGIAAIAGAIVIGFAALLVLALMRCQRQAEKILLAITRRLRIVDGDRALAVIEQLAGRLGEIARDRRLLSRAATWAALNWLLDAGALFVFIAAFGFTPNVAGVLVAFGLANVLAVIPITPGGLGIVEAALPATLLGFGVPSAIAVNGVLSYRLAAFWLPIPLGGIAYLTVRRDIRPANLREAAREAYESGESLIDWAEEFGHRPSDTDADAPDPSDGSDSPDDKPEGDSKPD
jgi:uncharacterized protein (TIRG00374 family)